MTLDEVLRATCVAIQPFIDRDLPNPREVDVMVAEITQLFEEQPHIQHAFIAMVQTIANEARKGVTS